MSTPVVAASDAESRSCSTAIQVRGSLPSIGVESETPDSTETRSMSMSGWRNRLNRTSASAPAASSRSAMLPTDEKYGLSFTATGISTADVTARRISRCRSSTSAPDVVMSPGTK